MQTLNTVIQKLTTQRNALRQQYAQLYVKIQYAKHHLKPAGRQQYLSYIGGLEAELSSVQAEVVAAKRLMNSFQQPSNRSKVLQQLQQVIAADMKPWHTRNAKLAHHAASADKSTTVASTKQKLTSVNALYAQLVEQLHPQLTAHEAVTNQYWADIQKAYRNADRLGLKLIQQSVAKRLNSNHDCYITLKNDLLRIQQGLETLEEQAAELRNDVELRITQQLSNDIWVHQRRGQLRKAIKQQTQQLNQIHQQMALQLQQPIAS